MSFEMLFIGFIGCIVIMFLADFFLMIFPKNLKGEINKKFFTLNFIGLISSAGMLIILFGFGSDFEFIQEIFGFCCLISLLTNIIRLACKNKLMLKKSQSVACGIAGAMRFISLYVSYVIIKFAY